MARFHDDSYTLGLKHLGQGQSDLLRQTLLYLESAREHFRNPGKLRETEDTTVGNISNVHLGRIVSNNSLM